jgi:hypothetical protein
MEKEPWRKNLAKMEMKPGLEMLALNNTQHPARKAPPPPGTAKPKKSLSRAQPKAKPKQIGARMKQDSHP